MNKMLLKDFISPRAFTDKVFEESIELSKVNPSLFEQLHTSADDKLQSDRLMMNLARLQVMLDNKSIAPERIQKLISMVKASGDYFGARKNQDLVNLVNNNIQMAELALNTRQASPDAQKKFLARFSADPTAQSKFQAYLLPKATQELVNMSKLPTTSLDPAMAA